MGLRRKNTWTGGNLVPDPMILEMVGRRLDRAGLRGNGCLFDGFPRTLAQAEALDEFLAAAALPLDGVLELDVDEDELVRRRWPRGREDDRPEVIRNRLDAYLRANRAAV